MIYCIILWFVQDSYNQVSDSVNNQFVLYNFPLCKYSTCSQNNHFLAFIYDKRVCQKKYV